MNTLEKIKCHAESIINKGAPFSKEDLDILNIFAKMNGKKAWNAGKRNARAENQRLISGKK